MVMAGILKYYYNQYIVISEGQCLETTVLLISINLEPSFWVALTKNTR